MNGIFIKTNYFLISLIIFIFISQLNFIKAEEEEDNTDYIIHFDLSDPNITLVADKNNPNPEINDIITNENSIFLPKVKLNKQGYFFSGWTEDWIYGFEPGDVFLCHSKNTTLIPVFGLLSDKVTYIFEYIVEFEGQITDISESLSKGYYTKNRIIQTSLLSYPQDKASQRGWTDGVNSFVQGQKMVMPGHNVTLYAMYFYYRTLTYVPGDVDGIVGILCDTQIMRAGGMKDLAEGTRLARKGYKMVCWHCENDGIDYPFFYQYIMPDENVTMTAVWEPITYTIVFNTGVSSIPNIKIKGETDTIIFAPFIEKEREGYTFEGWKMYENKIYLPGDEIKVEGQMPGIGISSKAVWSEN